MPRDRGPLVAAATPTRVNSLVAAAEVMTSGDARLAVQFRNSDWQERAWHYYDSVGELSFGVGWLANGMSRVNLMAAAPPLGPGDEPSAIDVGPDSDATDCQRRAAELVAGLGGGAMAQGQMLHSFGIHLSVVGICWMVAEPDVDDPLSDQYKTWDVFSADELRRPQGDPMFSTPEGVKIPIIEVQEDAGKWRALHHNALVVKVWRRHPRRRWEPEAPTRHVMRPLSQIDIMSKRIEADATSRLAGAGVLLMPSEAKFPKGQHRLLNQAAPVPVDADDEELDPPEDDFVETFIDATIIPIGDRSSPAAVTPLVVLLPGEYVDKVKHLTFSTPFDAKTVDLLDNAIRRLALGMDLPPEIMLGLGQSNHWSAWQVDENAIKMHLEPLAEIVAHALTVGYLNAALEAEGFDPAEAMVWYDTTDLTTRPDHSASAQSAYNIGAIGEQGYLTEMGLDTSLAPDDEERKRRTLLDFAKLNPSLALVVLLALGYIDQSQMDAAAAHTGAPPPGAGGPPAPAQPSNSPPAGASIALAAALDVVVDRAMERAGTRLRSAAGRGQPGGAASIACPDARKLHLTVDPTTVGLSTLLEGAWDRVEDIAARYGYDPTGVTATLSSYTRSLLASGQEHEYGKLAAALSAHATD